MKNLVFAIIAIMASLPATAQLLWKVSGNGSKGDSYIFATHHIAPISVLDSVPGLNEALKSIDAVYGEIEMSDMTSPSAGRLVMAFGAAPKDSTLTKVLNSAQIDTVNSVLAKYTKGMATVQQMDMLKPAMVNIQIAMLQALYEMVESPEFDGAEQLDLAVQKRAVADGKKVKGLESIEEQLGLLLCDPISRQVEDLMHTARIDGDASKKAHELATAYRTGNLEKLQLVMFDQKTGMNNDEAERLLYRRNDKWIRKLKEILPSEKVFIAVGAGHLIGEKGLIKQLKNLGYKIEPVKQPILQ